jgi:hypothetical protein
MFQAQSPHHQEVNDVNCLSLTDAQDSQLQTVTIPEAACTQLRRRPPDDERIALETCREI